MEAAMSWWSWQAIWPVMGAGIVFFSVLYLGFAVIFLALSKYLLPALNHGGILDPRPLPAAQIQRELGYSLLSILIFGTGIMLPWAMLKAGWAQLAQQATFWQIGLEIIALTLWNEVHFYLNHRLLHTTWFKRFHLPHHRSVVTTPWSTYAFHPVEAMLLGNVIIWPMLVHDFSLIALISLPIISILFNSIGHSNYDFLPDFAKDRWWLNGARRHHLHHACYHGNYGFMFPFMDRLFATELPIHAADQRIQGARKKF